MINGHTGAYYCMHRFYDPNTGRWLSRDPIGLEGGTNTYSYCNGNPVMWIDPTGLDGGWFGGFCGVLHGYWNVASNTVVGSIQGSPIAMLYYWSQDTKDWSDHGWSLSYNYQKGLARNKAMLTGLEKGVTHFFDGFTGTDPVAFGESWGNLSLFAFDTVAGFAAATEVSSAIQIANKNKVGYMFGKATGASNQARTVAMARQLASIRITDTPAWRNYVYKAMMNAYKHSPVIGYTTKGNAIMELLIKGPNGVIKAESYWDGSSLKSFELFGGRF